ncbi:MAG: copper homeostasis protein CutC [Bacteroidota bacterium]
MIVEWCTDGSEDIRRAQDLGINRMELCGALEVGGITPPLGVLRKARAQFDGAIFVMIRPKAGAFSVDPSTLKMMLEEIQWAANEGADGVVFGALTKEYRVDQEITKQLIQLAQDHGLKTTFHRAIDLTVDPENEASIVSRLGADFILSSGGKNKAEEGIDTLLKMHNSLSNSILIAGSGVSSSNALKFKNAGLSGIHFTARKVIESLPLNMGSEFELDDEKIQEILASI